MRLFRAWEKVFLTLFPAVLQPAGFLCSATSSNLCCRHWSPVPLRGNIARESHLSPVALGGSFVSDSFLTTCYHCLTLPTFPGFYKDSAWLHRQHLFFLVLAVLQPVFFHQSEVHHAYLSSVEAFLRFSILGSPLRPLHLPFVLDSFQPSCLLHGCWVPTSSSSRLSQRCCLSHVSLQLQV